MRVIIFVLSFALATNVLAQKIDILKKGHNYYKDQEYSLAMKEYEKLWNSAAGAKILGVDGKMNLADCYRLTDQPFKAKELYMQTMEYFADRADAHLHYGQVLKALGQYNDATAQFERHMDMMPEDGRAQEYIKQIEALRDIQPLYANVKVQAQEKVNSVDANQVGVTYYGDAVIYSSNEIMPNTTDKYFNMMVSGIDADGNLKSSEKFSVSLNVADRDDGPATFSRDGRLVYYTQSATDPEGKPVKQIWISSFRDGTWSEPKPLPIMYQGKDFTDPCLSADNKQLYFASNMKGTFGGMDIWVSNFEDGRWTAAKNLGKDINTKEDEGWPFIHPEGDLYFSSKGHPGYGGYDIFRTRPLGNGVDWLDVENMGEPFNSSFSDISFILSDNQTEGFMVSNRNKSLDIYRYQLVGEEPQELSDDIRPRVKVGITDKRNNDVLTPPVVPTPENTQTIIERQEDETPEDFEERKRLFEERQQNTETVDVDNLSPDPTRDRDPRENTTTDEQETGGTTSSGKVELIVKMQTVDGFGNPIANATITVRNKYTDSERVFNTDSKGLTIIRLDPDQKYIFEGKKEGYAAASIPVSTMGATQTETVAASIQLQQQK
jgi:hypothetical protein